MLPGATMLTSALHSTTLCFASPIHTHQLRDQLDHLHFEASNTRAKANKARQRLLRLSEAAEKLQRQAAISIQSGKENDARDLLFQKKKTMEALEKTKNRIELLDELCTKLIEAISLRERQLVGSVALDFEIERVDAAPPVRVVSPPSDNDLLNSSDDQHPQDKTHYNVEESLQVPVQLSSHNNSLIGSLKGITSYEDLLDHVDEHLDQAETELSMVVNFSAILEGEARLTNLKVQQMMEILDAVRRVRERISVIVQTQAEKK